MISLLRAGLKVADESKVQPVFKATKVIVAACVQHTASAHIDSLNLDTIGSFLIDTIWLLDVECEPTYLNSDASAQIQFSPPRAYLAGLARELVYDGILDQNLIKERLELDFLELAGLISSSKILARKVIRVNTSLLYKQQKFNLLREESEGYAKLITELSTSLPSSSKYSDDISSVNEKIDIVLRNIKALIGYFDLDPNRVLDVIFDIFASYFVDHWYFFVHLLLKSPWKPKTVENGKLRGRTICGQVLGFKFEFYKNKNDLQTPSTLYWIAALLIKYHIVELEDLLPYLGLDEEGIQKEKEDYLQSLKEEASNAGRFKNTAVRISFIRLKPHLSVSSKTQCLRTIQNRALLPLLPKKRPIQRQKRQRNPP